MQAYETVKDDLFVKQGFTYISVNVPSPTWVLDVPVLQTVLSQVVILCFL